VIRELRYRYVFPQSFRRYAVGGDMLDGATACMAPCVAREHGREVSGGPRRQARRENNFGWTPLMIADHVFTANVEWPETAAASRPMKERPADRRHRAIAGGGSGEARKPGQSSFISVGG
jgi:hypothetical protein